MWFMAKPENLNQKNAKTIPLRQSQGLNPHPGPFCITSRLPLSSWCPHHVVLCLALSRSLYGSWRKRCECRTLGPRPWCSPGLGRPPSWPELGAGRLGAGPPVLSWAKARAPPAALCTSEMVSKILSHLTCLSLHRSHPLFGELNGA